MAGQSRRTSRDLQPVASAPTWRALRTSDVLQVLKDRGLTPHRKTLEQWVRDGHFPKPFKVAGWRVYWRDIDVYEWFTAMTARR